MTTTTTRAGRVGVGLAALTLLAGCTTTVTGTGRPLAGGGSSAGSSSGSSSGSSPSSSSGSSSGTGKVDADGDAHDTWQTAIDTSNSTGGTVQVSGTISGAGVGGAQITASYAVGDDGEPVAKASIETDAGLLQIVATGGSAWAYSTAAVYEEYGYDATGSAQADGKAVLLTDDDSGLDVYSALESFLSLCGPTGDDPASLEEGTYGGDDVVVVNDEKYDTKAYVDPTSGRILASVYEDETVSFGYSDTTLTVDAPPADQVVTVDGF